jgi:hypothetical protein
MVDVDPLARRAVALIDVLARRAGSLAIGLAVLVGLFGLVAYGLGLAGLEGNTRSAWVVIGAALVLVAVGAPLLAAWRLHRVRRHSTALLEDMRKLLSRDAEAERVVIETVEVQEDAIGTNSPVVIGQTARFTRLQQFRMDDFRELPSALRAMATFPALMVLAILLLPIFTILSLIFFLAWIL